MPYYTLFHAMFLKVTRGRLLIAFCNAFNTRVIGVFSYGVYSVQKMIAAATAFEKVKFMSN